MEETAKQHKKPPGTQIISKVENCSRAFANPESDPTGAEEKIQNLRKISAQKKKNKYINQGQKRKSAIRYEETNDKKVTGAFVMHSTDGFSS